ncbi:Putative antitoxin [uncultured archaeon]|nr:Putative antitoxin [uncultured archaeon]
MARQISVSEEVYEALSKGKGSRSFSELIKEKVLAQRKKEDIMKFAGALKQDKKKLDELKDKIAAEREENYGRKA